MFPLPVDAHRHAWGRFLARLVSSCGLVAVLGLILAQAPSPSTAYALDLPAVGFPAPLSQGAPNAARGRQPAAESILLKDLSTGRTLYEFEPERHLSPASLTKIMTALVILEIGELQDPVTVSREAAIARKIHLRLRAGQVFTLEDLLKAMLITSANDACLAAVEHVAGSEDSFVSRMNAKARAFGLWNTHFSNACGFDAPDHYTTAADLAALSELALQHPVFRSLVRREVEVISPLNGHRQYILRNTNRLLGRMPGVEGIKTGFTARAGRCLVAKVSQDGKEILLVLLNSRRRWNTAATLIQYGLGNLEATATGVRYSQSGSLGGSEDSR